MFLTVPTLLTWGRIVAIPLIVGVFYLPLEVPTRNVVATALFIAALAVDPAPAPAPNASTRDPPRSRCRRAACWSPRPHQIAPATRTATSRNHVEAASFGCSLASTSTAAHCTAHSSVHSVATPKKAATGSARSPRQWQRT